MRKVNDGVGAVFNWVKNESSFLFIQITFKLGNNKLTTLLLFKFPKFIKK